SGSKAIPWFWVSSPGTYNTAHFKKAGFDGPPKTWDELLKMGKVLKKQGNPVGIPISHCSDAHSTYWSVAWCYGAKVLEADGKTPGIVSDKTAQVIEWYKELYKEFIAYLFQKQNFDAWIVASNAFNHPPLKNLADHPIWARNPKFAMLPKEAEYAHPGGWPAKPTEAVQRIDDNYILADMVAKAVNGMPTKRAMDWAQEQVALAIKGQLKVG